MAVTIAPVQPPVATTPVAPVTPQLTLQPGTVVSAQVVQLLENGLAQIAIDGIAIAALSEVPLQVGDVLQLAVSQAADGVIKLQIVPQATATSTGAVATVAAATAASGGAAPIVTTSASASPTAVSTSTPATPGSAEAIAIALAAQSAAPRQQSLSPLFANLPVVVASGAVPSQVQASASQLLALRPELSEQLTATDLRTAFDQSGLFLESSLAAGAAPTPQADLKAALLTFRETVTDWLAASGEGTVAAVPAQIAAASAPSIVPTQVGAPDLPSAPNVPIAQAAVAATTTALTPATANAGVIAETSPAVVPETSAPQLATLAQASPQMAAANAPLARAVPQPTNLTIAALEAAQRPLEGEAVRAAPQATILSSVRALQAILSIAAVARSSGETVPQSPAVGLHASFAALPVQGDAPAAPPPFRGAAPAAQPIAPPSVAPDGAPREIGHQLLEQADGAIARQTLLQLASLPDRVDSAGAQFNAQITDTSAQRWHFEIPFATPQGTALAQFEIERDGSGNQVEAVAHKVWRARFTLNIEPTGPVHALVSLAGDKTAVRMWAERPETAAKLRAQSADLVQALRSAELEPGDIVVSGGAPPQAAAKAGHFLDRAT